jgi:hypothetical protein
MIYSNPDNWHFRLESIEGASAADLERNSVVKESLTTAADGKKYRTDCNTLDVIISLGYPLK